ncbi:MAG: VIT domain-containing protein [Puniceicoccaceae bacterium]
MRSINPPFFLPIFSLRWRTLFLWLTTALLSTSLAAQTLSEQRTEAPYFWVDQAGEGESTLPLRESHAKVSIEGPIATVVLRQTYQNNSASPIHASYVFPGSTRAAVHDLHFEIGNRRIRAEIQEKAEAKKTFETAKAAGQQATLLEQHRPNVFQMRVANIMPGDLLTVELTYSETLERIGDDYTFVFPTVVGPRYSENQSEIDDSTRWVSSPYLAPETVVAPPGFSLAVHLNQALPLRRVGSPSHSLNVNYPSPNQGQISLTPTSDRPDNRDFVLHFSLAAEEPAVGLLLSSEPEAPDEGYFLLTLEPPAHLSPGPRVPREYIFVLDVSGSMNGFPLEISREIMRQLIGQLDPGERFNLISFASGSSIFSSEGSLSATPSNLNHALQWINNHQGGGGTSLLPALERVFALPTNEAFSRSIIVLTDGYVSIEAEAFRLVREKRGTANLFAFGIGSSVNRHLIEGLARAGAGEPIVALDPKSAKKAATGFIETIRHPLMTGIKLEFDGFKPYDQLPEEQGDLFLSKPIRMVGRYSGSQPHGTLRLTGQLGTEAFEKVLHLSGEPIAGPGLRSLWAREKVRSLEDRIAYERETGLREQIVALGLSHRLLTNYTSFVAVERVVVNSGGQGPEIEQPLPLPKGVSPLAIGGGIPGTPEPGIAILLSFVGMALFSYHLLARRR